MYGKSNMETYITICKIGSQGEFAVWLRKLKQGLCTNLGKGNREGEGREIQKGGNICIPVADSRRRQWHPTPVLLPGKSHGRRSLVGCSPWGHSESDLTERLHFHFSLSCIGEGNGTPLQCSCLEKPRDGGAWWAAVCGVRESQTRLKWLSSSSSTMADSCWGLTESNKIL